MAKSELSALETEVLIKRKKFAFFILGVLIGLEIVLIALVLYYILSGTWAEGSLSVAAVIPSLIAVGLPMYLGIKKINAELARRSDSQN